MFVKKIKSRGDQAVLSPCLPPDPYTALQLAQPRQPMCSEWAQTEVTGVPPGARLDSQPGQDGAGSHTLYQLAAASPPLLCIFGFDRVEEPDHGCAKLFLTAVSGEENALELEMPLSHSVTLCECLHLSMVSNLALETEPKCLHLRFL